MSRLAVLALLLAATSSAAPAEEGYISLFNGRDLTGWIIRGENQSSFQVVDGAIVRLENGSEWIYHNQQFGDFVLKLEFKIEEGGNSGVFFRVGDPNNYVWTGIEMQVFGDYGKEPSKHSSGAIYDLVTPRVNAMRPPGEWNSVTLECRGNWIRIDMNGTRIVEMDLDQWTEPAGKFPTPYAEMPRFGYLGFQNHGDPVAYRNVRIQVLE